MYLLPKPQQLELKDNYFLLSYDTDILIDYNLGVKEFHYALILKQGIQDCLGFSLNISKTYRSHVKTICLKLDINLKAQQYKLEVTENQITIQGGDSSAILYGVQTLRQIIEQNGSFIPCMKLLDYPSIQNRGFYHDVTRGRVPTLESLKALADKLSYYKLNQMQLYVEHSFLFYDFSEIWRDDTPLTAEDILELDAYCQSVNIELVPSIASFGHLHKVLSSKTYSSLCELVDADKEMFSFISRMEHHTVDVTNENSLIMIQRMLEDFIPLFSSKQFNICADETFDLGKGKSKKLAEKIGTDQLYVDFLKKICDIIKKYNKRPMFWGDIIVENPESIKKLPLEVICLNWDYNPSVKEDNVKILFDLGVTQYLCPGVQGWRRLINHYENAYHNILLMCKYAHKYKVEGVLNTDWGDYGHINHPEFSTTGLIYGACFSWNEEQIPYDEINNQISIIEYRDQSKKFVSIIESIARYDIFLWEHVVQYKELHDRKLSYKELKEYIKSIDLEIIQENNTNLSKTIDEIYKIIVSMDSSKRYLVKPYILAANGIKIFNNISLLIGQRLYQIDHDILVEPIDLAMDLERWFHNYKEIWRRDCKEGELFRIQEVINWYGNFLRDMK